MKIRARNTPNCGVNATLVFHHVGCRRLERPAFGGQLACLWMEFVGCRNRCRANMAHTRQSRPDSGLGSHVKVLKTLQVVPDACLGSQGKVLKTLQVVPSSLESGCVKQLFPNFRGVADRMETAGVSWSFCTSMTLSLSLSLYVYLAHAHTHTHTHIPNFSLSHTLFLSLFRSLSLSLATAWRRRRSPGASAPASPSPAGCSSPPPPSPSRATPGYESLPRNGSHSLTVGVFLRGGRSASC